MASLSEVFLQKELELNQKLINLDFGPKVEYIYNPLEYAIDVHRNYLSKFCAGPKPILFLGMNPGPWGMMQNAIPFGECTSVRDFLQVFGTINKPIKEHPGKPVLGFECKRSEVSGRRFWSLAEALGKGSPFGFFKNSFVHNYFPLCLLSSSGKNVTPPELRPEIRREIEEFCDESLVDILLILKVEHIVGIGRFAEKRAQKVVDKFKLPIKVVFIPHPSPRNPASNKDWLLDTKKLLFENNLGRYFCC